MIALAAIMVYSLSIARLQQETLQQSIAVVYSKGNFLDEGPLLQANLFHRLPVNDILDHYWPVAKSSPKSGYSKLLLKRQFIVSNGSAIAKLPKVIKADQQLFGLTIRLLIYPSHFYW